MSSVASRLQRMDDNRDGLIHRWGCYLFRLCEKLEMASQIPVPFEQLGNAKATDLTRPLLPKSSLLQILSYYLALDRLQRHLALTG